MMNEHPEGDLNGLMTEHRHSADLFKKDPHGKIHVTSLCLDA